jgi:Protein of unknown function (DUF3618)
MAQDPNEVMRPSSSMTSLASPSDTDHLRRQIADTRAGMTNTIDAIQDRVNPRSVINRTVASIKSKAIDRFRNFADTAGSAAGYVAARTAPVRARAMSETRAHPARAAMAGAASVAAMWMMVRSLRGGRRSRNYLYGQAL